MFRRTLSHSADLLKEFILFHLNNTTTNRNTDSRRNEIMSNVNELFEQKVPSYRADHVLCVTAAAFVANRKVQTVFDVGGHYATTQRTRVA